MARVGSWELDVEEGRPSGLRWSAEVFRIVGREPDDAGPTLEAFLGCVHPEDRARAYWPLRERRSDIPVLAAYYLDKYSRAMSRGFQEIAPEAARLLEGYAWPGNIRELKNVMEKICIMHRGPRLLPEQLPPEIAGAPPLPVANGLDALLDRGTGLEEALSAFERQLVQEALSRCNGNVLQAAALLQIPRGTLRYKLEKLGLV